MQSLKSLIIYFKQSNANIFEYKKLIIIAFKCTEMIHNALDFNWTRLIDKLEKNIILPEKKYVVNNSWVVCESL